ncbi:MULTISPECIES: phosphoglucosamine mutase [Ruminococcus]|uniref:Phosphoglucosamine mutase n=1 Tax=Ruminococcus flavefaciens TaxID=1265 RepID=A0A1M7GLF3_RUMFL|nr:MULTISPECIES: phosphoglucosamine mutase [Ruminococcus]MCR4795877.1 phosphoglucosamine mutase [Ruminococcus sp.]SHM17113.1 phosphoglucosamine mutase [Ruminococcus flavefaciens]
MAKLFGTDGSRGIAVTDLTCELAMQTGRAAALVLAKKDGAKTKILIGKDTRVSSDALEAAVCAGICSVGADAELLGIVPTPALSYLIGVHEADGGIMISGSHNSAEYNGLKLFSAKGLKLMEEDEDEIERLVFAPSGEIKLSEPENVGRILHGEDAVREYIDHIKSVVTTDLSGLKVALDCANGCAAYTAERLFSELGAEVLVIADKPNGTNINKDCGSTHVHHLMEYVVENGCDCGLAFDGDADRCIAVDENGCLIDGDRLLAIFAEKLKSRGLLDNDTAVVTAMSGLGLRKYAAAHDIKLVSSGAGKRYVLERMLEGGYKLGGEPNGHIIFLDEAGTGDGQLTGARLLEILKNDNVKLSGLAGDMPAYPQVKLNVKIHPHYKELWKNEKSITELIEKYDKELCGEGRIMVRESGKEPIVRILIEGCDFGRINDMAVDIAQHIKESCAYKI